MLQWWNSLGTTGQIFALIAIPSTLVLIVQTFLLFFGFDGSDSLDGAGDIGDTDVFDGADTDGDGFALFSIRGIVAMLCVAGWSGLAMFQAGWNPGLVILLSSVFGVLALFGMAFMMKAIMKLQDNGNIDLGSSVGKCGKVYIPIPPSMSGNGKINITLQERFLEVDAVTACNRTIKTGETVRVVATDEFSTLVVEPVINSDN